MNKGYTFLSNGPCSAAALNALVDSGTLTPTDITAWAAKTTTVGADRALIADSADSNTLKSVTLANLVPASSITPAKLDATGYYVGEAWRVQASGAHGWNWMPGGSSNLILQETTSAGAALDPFKIPIQIFEGTASNTLWLNSTGISIKTDAAPDYALDVGGTARSTKAVIKAAAPMLAFTDTTDPYYAGLYVDAGYWFWSQLATEGGAAVANTTALAVAVTAPNNSLRVDVTGRVGIGTASPAYTLDVVGSLHCSAGFYLGATATPTGTSDGTAGQVAWDTNYLYVCTTTGTGGAGRWKRAALSSF